MADDPDECSNADRAEPSQQGVDTPKEEDHPNDQQSDRSGHKVPFLGFPESYNYGHNAGQQHKERPEIDRQI